MQPTLPPTNFGNTSRTPRLRVRDVMMRNVPSLEPNITVHDAAKKFSDLDVKALPVCDSGRLVGMVTDRDLVVRVLATTGRADAVVRSAMTEDVVCAFEDDDLQTLIERLDRRQIAQVPVVTRENQLIGVIVLADIAGSMAAARWNAEVAKGRARNQRERPQ